MAFPNHIVVFHRLDFTSPYAIGDNIDRCFLRCSLRFSRGITSFLVAVGLSLPLGILPFCCSCWTFLAPWHTSLVLLDLSCFLAYFFPRLTSLHYSPSHLVLRHPSYCYRLWSHMVDHWLHIESPPLGSLLAVPCWLSSPSVGSLWPLPSCLVVPALRTPLLSGSVLAL